MILALTALALLAQAADTVTPAGARDPAYGPDGRLAIAVRGDLWVQSAPGDSGAWVRLTSGIAWDREPAWTRDGTAIVFSSDRAGAFDLWRVSAGVGADGSAGGEPERLTSSPEPEGAPAVAPDGRIVFVRGRGAGARLHVRAMDGTVTRLTSASDVGERWPSISPDGRRVAYVAVSERARQLRVRDLAGERETTIASDRAAEHPAWAPDGGRLVFTSGGARPGVWVAASDGRWVSFVTERHAQIAWSPDGSTLALVDVAPSGPGYNGDPDRLGDRAAHDAFPDFGRLWLVDAPREAEPRLVVAPDPAAENRTTYNAEQFDRAWERVQRLYYSGADAADRRARWEAIGRRHRPAAIAAGSEAQLEAVIHAMMRERPALVPSATGRAAISSAHPVATEAGLEILRKGGNVVDAAVAVSFALGVVEPDASGVGGYGQMLIHRAGADRPELIEFMSRVPEAGGIGALADGGRRLTGPALTNVPGTVAAMHLAWRKHGSGRLAWADLVAPAIRSARDGYVVSDALATTLAVEREHFARHPSSVALFFRDGEPLRAGDTLRNPDLAWVLERIARDGAAGLYGGEVARRMVDDLRRHGSPMTLQDLARYHAVEREPVSTTYRGHTIYASAPPVAGGASLAARLNLLEQWRAPKRYTEDAATLHAMIAAWQLVPPMRVADPGLWPVDIGAGLSKDTARARWRCFDATRAIPAESWRGNVLACASPAGAPVPEPDRSLSQANEGGGHDDIEASFETGDDDGLHRSGTTAFAVADADGNVVSVTQTLGTWGGTFYVSPGLGFLYNDKLLSYPGDPNAYGARLPFARHGSTITPAIVFRGTGASQRPVLALGAAGNAWITSAVYQTLVGVVDFGLGPQEALELPRFLPSGRSGMVQYEADLAPEVVRRLTAMGYRLQPISLRGELRMGYGAAVVLGDGSVTAGGDPRRGGGAGAVR
ncbi:MAG TPA: gamma-glutamyltransferase [Gemmatimonadaceae bacterium]|nr:gamma-glutamyltransferase [Gemmatimonadaceae bacterium]